MRMFYLLGISVRQSDKIVVQSCEQIVHGANVTENVVVPHAIVFLLRNESFWHRGEHKPLVSHIQNESNVPHVDSM